MRTNIVIDDEVMQKALLVSGLKTKKEVVERALVEYVEKCSRKNLMDLKGQIRFSEGYDYKATRGSIDDIS